ncbi:MAG: AAA family ATPase [Planctomycetaceae bacterium]
MISRIQILNYRCFSYIDQELDRYHVLVGPNASGKTTFLDAPAFLGELVADGLDAALQKRTPNFLDLLFLGAGTGFELAVEMVIPPAVLSQIGWDHDFHTARYQVAIQLSEESGQVEIIGETFALRPKPSVETPPEVQQMRLFPSDPPRPETVMLAVRRTDMRAVVSKRPQGNDNFYPETSEHTNKSWAPSFRLGPRRSALGNLPEDESKYPVATWFREQLTNGLQYLVLDSLIMRRPSPPGRPKVFQTDGSNLPWVIESLRSGSPELFADWIAHLQSALPNLLDIKTVERPEDRHRYLIVCYENGHEAPSWVVSDGTLRLLALTLPAYLPNTEGLYLVEEPENGIHPSALESLSHVPDAQVLVAGHSQGILSGTAARQILCFARSASGATDIVRGDQHPRLLHWRGEVDPGTLLAAGVLS